MEIRAKFNWSILYLPCINIANLYRKDLIYSHSDNKRYKNISLFMLNQPYINYVIIISHIVFANNESSVIFWLFTKYSAYLSLIRKMIVFQQRKPIICVYNYWHSLKYKKQYHRQVYLSVVFCGLNQTVFVTFIISFL